jgi:hypothetical protein
MTSMTGCGKRRRSTSIVPQCSFSTNASAAPGRVARRRTLGSRLYESSCTAHQTGVTAPIWLGHYRVGRMGSPIGRCKQAAPSAWTRLAAHSASLIPMPQVESKTTEVPHRRADPRFRTVRDWNGHTRLEVVRSPERAQISHDVHDQLLGVSLAAPADAGQVRGTGRPTLAVEARIEPLYRRTVSGGLEAGRRPSSSCRAHTRH